MWPGSLVAKGIIRDESNGENFEHDLWHDYVKRGRMLTVARNTQGNKDGQTRTACASMKAGVESKQNQEGKEHSCPGSVTRTARETGLVRMAGDGSETRMVRMARDRRDPRETKLAQFAGVAKKKQSSGRNWNNWSDWINWRGPSGQRGRRGQNARRNQRGWRGQNGRRGQGGRSGQRCQRCWRCPRTLREGRHNSK